MKIEYGSTTLGDDAVGDFILDSPARSHSRAVQGEDLAFAANPFTKGRANGRNDFAFSIAKEHADADAAMLFFITHPDALDDNAALKITHGGTVKQMADAAIKSVSVQITGKSTTASYTFTGGAFATP